MSVNTYLFMDGEQYFMAISFEEYRLRPYLSIKEVNSKSYVVLKVIDLINNS